MSQAFSFSDKQIDATRQLATFASRLSYDAISEKAQVVGKHALLDWVGVALAGSQESLVTILQDEAAAEGSATRRHCSELAPGEALARPP